jgi:hypothetical protein
VVLSRFTWPLEVSLAAGDDDVAVHVPVRRDRCPECGAPLDG